MKITAERASQILSNQYHNFTGRPVPEGTDEVKTLDQLAATMPEFCSGGQEQEFDSHRMPKSMVVRPMLSK